MKITKINQANLSEFDISEEFDSWLRAGDDEDHCEFRADSCTPDGTPLESYVDVADIHEFLKENPLHYFSKDLDELLKVTSPNAVDRILID